MHEGSLGRHKNVWLQDFTRNHKAEQGDPCFQDEKARHLNAESARPCTSGFYFYFVGKASIQTTGSLITLNLMWTMSARNSLPGARGQQLQSLRQSPDTVLGPYGNRKVCGMTLSMNVSEHHS